MGLGGTGVWVGVGLGGARVGGGEGLPIPGGVPGPTEGGEVGEKSGWHAANVGPTISVPNPTPQQRKNWRREILFTWFSICNLHTSPPLCEDDEKVFSGGNCSGGNASGQCRQKILSLSSRGEACPDLIPLLQRRLVIKMIFSFYFYLLTR